MASFVIVRKSEMTDEKFVRSLASEIGKYQNGFIVFNSIKDTYGTISYELQ